MPGGLSDGVGLGIGEVGGRQGATMACVSINLPSGYHERKRVTARRKSRIDPTNRSLYDE